MTTTNDDLFPGEEDTRNRFTPESMTFGDYNDAEQAAVLAELPTTDATGPDSKVTTSVRLPFPLFAALKQRAEESGTTPSALIRSWLEEKLAVPSADPVTEIGRGLSIAAAAFQQIDRAA